MRFGLIHRVMTDALAVIGVLALVTSSKLRPEFSWSVLLFLVLALALPERWKQQGLMKVLGVAAPLLLLSVQAARLLLGADPIPVVVEFAAVLQVIRLSTRRGAIHDHQVILLALLHLIAGTVLGGGLTYALSLVGFLVLTPGSLVLSHLRREVEGNYRQGARDRTGMPVDVPRILRSRRVIGRGFLAFTCVLSVPVFLFTAFLFVLFPRVGFSWLSVPTIEPRRMVGFSDHVDLGGVGTIRSDPTLVMRVRPKDLQNPPPVRRNLYLRGAVFDGYDGRAWSRRVQASEPLAHYGEVTILRRAPRPDTDRQLSIDLEPIQPSIVFIPGEAVAIRVPERAPVFGSASSPLRRGSRGELEYDAHHQQGLRYEVFLPRSGLVVPEVTAASELSRYLVVPHALSSRVRALAQQMAPVASEPAQIAHAIEAALRQGYKYDLGSPSGGAKDPLDHFLFESRRGHCEFYSTAMAMLLRVRGVPSRNVTGFVGGTFNRFGEFYAVRQGDAHSWVEAYLPELGWTRFDPTPPGSALPQASTDGLLAIAREMVEAAAQGWQKNVEGFSLDQQVGLFQTVRALFRQTFGSDEEQVVGGRRANWKQRGALAVGALVLAAVAYWVRRRARTTITRNPSAGVSRQRSIELYLRLERALAMRGVPRPQGTPPRTHAEALCEAGHPVGPEAVRLTELYLGARFGEQPLTPADERDFRASVEQLRRRPASAA